MVEVLTELTVVPCGVVLANTSTVNLEQKVATQLL